MASDNWEAIIRGALRAEVEKIASEEVDAAKARIDSRISEKMAAVVMATVRHFDVVRNQDHIVITVHDDRQR